MTMGHDSPNNMKSAIRVRYHWEGMFSGIEDYCQSSTTCQKAAAQEINTKNKVIETTSQNENRRQIQYEDQRIMKETDL